jgi:hypothetical protein
MKHVLPLGFTRTEKGVVILTGDKDVLMGLEDVQKLILTLPQTDRNNKLGVFLLTASFTMMTRKKDWAKCLQKHLKAMLKALKED